MDKMGWSGPPKKGRTFPSPAAELTVGRAPAPPWGRPCPPQTSAWPSIKFGCPFLSIQCVCVRGMVGNRACWRNVGLEERSKELWAASPTKVLGIDRESEATVSAPGRSPPSRVQIDRSIDRLGRMLGVRSKRQSAVGRHRIATTISIDRILGSPPPALRVFQTCAMASHCNFRERGRGALSEASAQQSFPRGDSSRGRRRRRPRRVGLGCWNAYAGSIDRSLCPPPLFFLA